jgi:Uma2 family endonuclease
MVRTVTAGHKPVETDAPPEDGSYSGPWHVATLEEFLALPEVKPALEFEEGRIIQKVSPRGPHSVLQAELLEIFNRAGRPNKIARAFPERAQSPSVSASRST